MGSWPIITCGCIMIVGVLASCSPCILPVLPIYLSLLAADAGVRAHTKDIEEEQKSAQAVDQKVSQAASQMPQTESSTTAPATAPTKLHDTPLEEPKPAPSPQRHNVSRIRRFVLPACFTLGISVAFISITLAGTLAASLLSEWKATLSWVGGIVIIFLGILMIIPSTPIMNRLPHRLQQALIAERHLRRAAQIATSPFSAFLLGFSFSFAWTPCVGPALSMLALVSAAETDLVWRIAYLACFTIGFMLPFILISLISTPMNTLVQKHSRLMKYGSLVGGAVIVIIGIMMVCGVSMRTPAPLSVNTPDASLQPAQKEDAMNAQPAENTSSSKNNSLIAPNSIIPPDQRKQISFGTVPTQGDKTLSIDQPSSKVTILTCFATWCGPCKQELPHLQTYYEKTCQHNESDEVRIYLVSQPSTLQNKQASDEPKEVVEQFLAQKKIDIPCLFDMTGRMYQQLNVEVFPCSYILDAKGRVAAVVTGAVPVAVIDAYVHEIGSETPESQN